MVATAGPAAVPQPAAPAWRLTALTVLHLAAWSELGTLTRIYLEQLFGAACSPSGRWAWIPCVTSSHGALFTDVPPNVAGSFIMGVLASTEVLTSAFHLPPSKSPPLPLLPQWHAWQAHAPLLVGLRTGYCGSLTTFSSWITQMVEMFVGGTSSYPVSLWVEALCGLFIGTVLPIGALVMGQHVALALYFWWQPPTAVEGTEAPPPPPPVTPLPSSTAGADTVDASGSSRLAGVQQQRQQGEHEDQRQVTVVLAEAELGPVHRRGSASSCDAAGGPTASGAAAAAPAPAPAPATGRSLEWVAGAPGTAGTAGTGCCRQWCYSKWWGTWLADALAAAVFVSLTAVSIALAVTEDTGRQATTMRYFWIAILLAPVGCLLRWQLAVYNGRLRNPAWAWFPLGTFAANMIACAVNFAVISIKTRVTSLSQLDLAVLQAIMTGISGALSTVSTWVVELQKLNLPFPRNCHGYNYWLISVCTAVALGVVIYGTSVWTQ